MTTGAPEDYHTWSCSKDETPPEDQVEAIDEGDPRSGSPDMEGARNGADREIGSARYNANMCNILEKIIKSK